MTVTQIVLKLVRINHYLSHATIRDLNLITYIGSPDVTTTPTLGQKQRQLTVGQGSVSQCWAITDKWLAAYLYRTVRRYKEGQRSVDGWLPYVGQDSVSQYHARIDKWLATHLHRIVWRYKEGQSLADGWQRRSKTFNRLSWFATNFSNNINLYCMSFLLRLLLSTTSEFI